MSVTVVSDTPTPAPEAAASETAEAAEAHADAAVEIAETNANRDIAIAAIHAETEQARIETEAQTAETIAEAVVDAAQTEQTEWQTKLAALEASQAQTAADVSSIRETLETLASPNPAPGGAESEATGASLVVPELAAPPVAEEPKPRKRPHRWI